MSIDEYIETSDALFHYTKASIAIENILHTKKFKLSILNDANDPREYKDWLLNMSVEDPSNANISRDLLHKAHNVVNRISKYECRVMCFCTNNKPTLILSDGNSVEDKYVCSKGWNKSRMWSQYGQAYYGICIVLSKSALEIALGAIKPQIRYYRASDIHYSQHGKITITLNGDMFQKGGEEYLYNHIIENFEELFFRKHIDYRDEAEFRVVMLDPDKKLEYLDVSSLIKCVIVGDRTPDVYIPLINQMCTDLNIESRRAYWVKGQPHLLLCKSTEL